MNRRVEQVVVVGADAPAYMAAAAIQRSLGTAGVRVRVIELPSVLQPVDVYSTLPALAGFHFQLGLEERFLFEACKAVPVAAQRFSNWSGAAAPFIHGYDSPSLPGTDLRFTQLWLKGRQRGLRAGFENFSLGAMAGRASRVPVPGTEAELSAGIGYHLDARAYTSLLRHCALKTDIESRAATVADVEIDGDRIAAIVLADGERVEGDLFVDASGPQAVLIGRMPGTEFESWREWLPCDRMIVAAAPALRPYPGFSQISAFRHGWFGLFPLQDRTAVVAAYDSRQSSDQAALDALPVLAKLPINGDAVVSNLNQGIRKRLWVGNCVAVGEAAFSLEPLDAVQLHITHNCISQLMTLFPVAADAFRATELYDRTIRRVAANLRDFQAAHYKLNRRFDQPLWDRCRDAAIPETLQRKLDLFAARGRVPLYDDETFMENSWEALLIGHGLAPQSYDPRVEALPEREHIGLVEKRLQDVARLVEAMPPVGTFIAGPRDQTRAEAGADA